MYTKATRGFSMPEAGPGPEGDSLAACDDGAAGSPEADEFPLLPPPHADSAAVNVKIPIAPSDHDLFILFIFFLPDSLSSSWSPISDVVHTIRSRYFQVNLNDI